MIKIIESTQSITNILSDNLYQNNFPTMNCKTKSKTHVYDLYQYALTDEGVLGVDAEPCPLLLPQSFPFLEAIAAKNLSFHLPLPSTTVAAVAAFLHTWSAGNRCFKHTFNWQVLHVLVFEKVSISLHRLTGQVGFFFFLGSQLPDFSCFSNIAFSSSPSRPVVSIDIEQVSQTTTFLLLWSDFGHSWAL